MGVGFDFSVGPRRAGLKATSDLATVVRQSKSSGTLELEPS